MTQENTCELLWLAIHGQMWLEACKMPFYTWRSQGLSMYCSPTFHGMPDTAWFKKIGFHMAPNLSKSNMKSHAVHLDRPIVACAAWILNNKKHLLSWSFISCEFPTLKTFSSDFQKSYLGKVFLLRCYWSSALRCSPHCASEQSSRAAHLIDFKTFSPRVVTGDHPIKKSVQTDFIP